MKPLRAAIPVCFGLFCSVSAVNAAVTLAPVTNAWANNANGATPLAALYNGDSLVKTNPDDVSTWTHGVTTSAWQKTWQADGANTHPTWNKMAWVILDLGSVQTELEKMYLWNVTENSSGTIQRGTQTFRIFYADGPITSAVAAADYSFTTGWTQLGGIQTLAQAATAGPHDFDGSYDLSGIASARYIGLELLTNYGSVPGPTPAGVDSANRIGLAEVVFTVVPEPSSALLALTGLTACVIRRRRI